MLRLLEDSCALQIGVLGLNFKTAGLDLQEEMARGASSLSGEKGFFSVVRRLFYLHAIGLKFILAEKI
jgi:hypothetical protein